MMDFEHVRHSQNKLSIKEKTNRKFSTSSRIRGFPTCYLLTASSSSAILSLKKIKQPETFKGLRIVA